MSADANGGAENDDRVSLEGRVAVVTGAGAGLGRAEALALARAGASVVVNDLVENDAVEDTLARIRDLGAEAEFVPGSVAERETADAMLAAAHGKFGGLDIVVNNAGITRDRMLPNMSDDEWDSVVAVHLRGHFLLSRNAAAYWRDRSKQEGGPVYGRLVNTSSEAGLLGPPGQPNYGAAKAGITALTLSAARGLERYGVRANVICPRARTSMTEAVFGDAPDDGHRSALARPRRESGRLSRLPGGRSRQRAGLHRLRTHGGPDGRAGRRAAFRRRRAVDPRSARRRARRLLRRS